MFGCLDNLMRLVQNQCLLIKTNGLGCMCIHVYGGGCCNFKIFGKIYIPG